MNECACLELDFLESDAKKYFFNAAYYKWCIEHADACKKYTGIKGDVTCDYSGCYEGIKVKFNGDGLFAEFCEGEAEMLIPIDNMEFVLYRRCEVRLLFDVIDGVVCRLIKKYINGCYSIHNKI